MTFDWINSDIVRVSIDDIKHRGVSIRRNEKTRFFGWRLMDITERYKISSVVCRTRLSRPYRREQWVRRTVSKNGKIFAAGANMKTSRELVLP